MTCTQCGADAAIKRKSAYYCGRCAVARDWGEIIAVVQHGAGASDESLFAPVESGIDEPVAAANGTPADPFAP